MEALEVLTKNGCKKIAVVTLDNIQGLKSGTINLSGIEIKLEPCPCADDIVAAVENCIEEGYDGIAGCIVLWKQPNYMA